MRFAILTMTLAAITAAAPVARNAGSKRGQLIAVDATGVLTAVTGGLDDAATSLGKYRKQRAFQSAGWFVCHYGRF